MMAMILNTQVRILEYSKNYHSSITDVSKVGLNQANHKVMSIQ